MKNKTLVIAMLIIAFLFIPWIRYRENIQNGATKIGEIAPISIIMNVHEIRYVP